MNTFQKVAALTNKVVVAVLDLPVIGKLAGKSMTVITYTGRKSGKTFSLPVGFTQKGNVLSIGVAFPEKKNWWRNFQNDGDKLTVALHGVDRTGHAVSRRNDKGQVSVRVTLDATS
ncbi:hypothetical protein ACHIPZ_02475 [Antrihabitans sp. NCIMB 15449]|jgi:hypothetical protein|uniref:Nitroreductase family deazaflavin-dependent oxidoreductase n=1 Tax=Antrihabitans spumae TaxID=3373370 RepID=A0ABW7JIX5_9NOCA